MNFHASDMDTSPTAVIHATLGSGIFAAIMGWLPQIMGLVAGIIGASYYLISIWESKTVQHWVTNRRMIQKAKKIARLKAKEKVIIAQLEALQVVRIARREAAARVADAAVEAEKLITHEQTAVDISNVPPRDLTKPKE